MRETTHPLEDLYGWSHLVGSVLIFWMVKLVKPWLYDTLWDKIEVSMGKHDGLTWFLRFDQQRLGIETLWTPLWIMEFPLGGLSNTNRDIMARFIGLFDQENGRKTKPSQVNPMLWHHFMGKPSWMIDIAWYLLFMSWRVFTMSLRFNYSTSTSNKEINSCLDHERAPL